MQLVQAWYYTLECHLHEYLNSLLPRNRKIILLFFIKVCGSRPPTLADRKELKITEAIMAESFRLGSPAPLTTPHRAVKVASVSHSVHSGCPHVTITRDALDLTVQVLLALPSLGHQTWDPSPPRPTTSDMGPRSPGPASDIWWPSLEPCSNLFT